MLAIDSVATVDVQGATEEATLSYATFKEAFAARQTPLPTNTHPMYLALLGKEHSESLLVMFDLQRTWLSCWLISCV